MNIFVGLAEMRPEEFGNGETTNMSIERVGGRNNRATQLLESPAITQHDKT